MDAECDGPEPKRYLPDVPLPPYSYVTGRFPHPLRDSAGHSYGVEPEPCPPPESERWRECAAYLRGLDLFNSGYYWEAHESWEQAWHAAGRRGPIADFFKGLIKLAAAGVKAREGSLEGVRAHGRRGAELFRGVKDSPRLKSGRYFGLALERLVEAAEALEHYSGAQKPWSGVPADKAFDLTLVAE
jgi:predicted metal-dependent hydrolase